MANDHVLHSCPQILSKFGTVAEFFNFYVVLIFFKVEMYCLEFFLICHKSYRAMQYLRNEGVNQNSTNRIQNQAYSYFKLVCGLDKRYFFIFSHGHVSELS